MCIKNAPSLRQGNPPFTAFEKRDSIQFFQSLDMLGHRWLGDMQRLSRTGEIQFLRDGLENM